MQDSNKTESIEHILGKEIAKNLLRKDSFYDYEILEEYPIVFPSGRMRYIDIVCISISRDKKIAYEIGGLNGGSLEELYCLFKEVHNLEKVEYFGNDKLRIVLEFFETELDYKEQMLHDAIIYENNEFKDCSIKQDIIVSIINSPKLFWIKEFFNDKWELCREKILEYVDKEIDFVYRNLDISKNYRKMQRILVNYYENRIIKDLKKYNIIKEKDELVIIKEQNIFIDDDKGDLNTFL